MDWPHANAGSTPVQINAKKAAINGHPDQSACHGWYNSFGSNGKVGNYCQRVVTDNATGAIVRPADADQQLPAARRAGL